MEVNKVEKIQQFQDGKAQGAWIYYKGSSLNKLLEKVDNALRNHFNHSLCSIDSIELGLIATSNIEPSISLVKSIYNTTVKNLDEDDNLFLDDETVKLIESQFLLIYKQMVKSAKKSVWNKAKLIIFNNNCRSPVLKFKYDSDLDWVESLDVNSSEYNALSSDVEAKINQWDGLPKDFPRIWIH